MKGPQQLKSIAVKRTEGSSSPDPALLQAEKKKKKREVFNSNVKSTEGECLPNPNWELVPQRRGLLLWNHKKRRKTFAFCYALYD